MDGQVKTSCLELGDIVEPLPFNRDETSANFLEYTWGVTFETSGREGIENDVEMALKNFKLGSGLEQQNILDGTQHDIWVDNSAVGDVSAEIEGDEILLTASIEQVRELDAITAETPLKAETRFSSGDEGLSDELVHENQTNEFIVNKEQLLGSEENFSATDDAETFTLDQQAAADTASNTLIDLEGFDPAGDTLEINLAQAFEAPGVSTLDELDGVSVDGAGNQARVTSNPIENETTATFGPDADADADADAEAISLELVGVTEPETVDLAIV